MTSQQSCSSHIKNCGYRKDRIINPKCPACLEIWNKFLDKNDFYVCGYGICQRQVHKDYNMCDEHFDY